MLAGHLLPTECSETDVVGVNIWNAHQQELRTKRLRTALHNSEAVAPAKLIDMAGMKVFVDPTATTDEPSIRAAIAQFAKLMRLHMQAFLGGADLYVVPRPADVSQRMLYHLVLGGGRTCDHSFLLSNGAHGASVVYKPAIIVGGTRSKPRYWWASAACHKEHSYFCKLLNILSQEPRSVWCEMSSSADLAHQVEVNHRGPKRQHRPLQAIGILIAREKAENFACESYMLTIDELLGKFTHLDVRKSTVGANGH